MKLRTLIAVFLLLALGLPSLAASDAPPGTPGSVARTVLALYDGRDERIRWSQPHTLAEMPLNYLGLRLRYLDINHPLPDPGALGKVRGVLVWIQDDSMPDPEGFLDWSGQLITRGVRFLFIGDFPFQRDRRGRKLPRERIERFLRRLGIEILHNWTTVTYDVRFVIRDPALLDYERPLDGVLPAFSQVRATHPESRVYLRSRRGGDPETDSDLVFTTPWGGYIAGGYTHYQSLERRRRQWYLNPFEFFRRAFDTDALPKPDPTTLSGRRLYYSHIDGDGWRNHSEIAEYKKEQAIAAEVIFEEVLRAYPDLPVTVAPIAGDLDPEWFGSERTRQIARKILALPHVEAGSHTYSHPFEWAFFEDGDAEKERAYFEGYPRHWGQSSASSLAASLWGMVSGRENRAGFDHGAALEEEGNEAPRAYALRPFDLDLEIRGAVEHIEKLLPEGKRVKVLQWSGDTLPFEAALKAAREVGLRNINGGDTRFDRDYASLGWVAPIGRPVGREQQIYASNSNENTYTDLWTDRYFGFMHLTRTFRNTELPRRLKPLNVYYHMYSGEKLSSLNALLANLEYVRKRKVAPVWTSEYAAIAEGFYSTELIPEGRDAWRVINRGRLQTIRFDGATFRAADLGRCQGVIGQRHLHGSLYVALDPAVERPLVALRPLARSDRLPQAQRAYLLESRWGLSHLELRAGGLSVRARGFGRGRMSWKMPRGGLYRYRLVVGGQTLAAGQARTSPQGVLALDLPSKAIEPVLLELRPQGPRGTSGPGGRP